MQITIAPSSGAGDFNAHLYPEQNPLNFQWMANQFENFSGVLNDMGRQMLEASKNAFQQRLEDTQRFAKQVLRTAKNIFKPNMIRPLETVAELQAAEQIMQRYILAHPETRALYHKQRLDGYSDAYVDVDPGKIGRWHYDYLQVMDGIAQIDESDDPNAGWTVWSTDHDEERGDNRRKHFVEQMYILDTWKVQEQAIKDGHDFTDIFGGKLG